MAVKIKLKRMGKIREPQYRIIVANAQAKRDGRAIEEVGKYQPKEEPSFIEVKSERVQYWLSVGAQPTQQVLNILKLTGDWQQFKGEPATSSLKQPAVKTDKKAIFEAAAKEAMAESADGATTPKSKGKKADKGSEQPETAEGQSESAQSEG